MLAAPAIISLFEGSPPVWTKTTLDTSRRGLKATSAEPLALGDVRDPIALLVNSQVAEITEEDYIGVGRLPVHTNAADCVVVNRG